MAPILIPKISAPKLVVKADSELLKRECANAPAWWFEMDFNGRTLKYTMEILGKGTKPAAGFPLYLGLHGGGGDSDGSDNDESWVDVSGTMYRDPINKFYANEGAVLVCPRGISTGTYGKDLDPWFCHWVPEVFPLIEKLIFNLTQNNPPELQVANNPVAKAHPEMLNSTIPFVNANKVFLWGFSAGGDGAFRHAAFIPDRFAGIIPAAGHPGWSRGFVNAANVKLIMEVGEDDYIDNAYPFQRAYIYLSMAETPMQKLENALPSADKGLYYRHKCFVVKNEYRNSVTKYNTDWQYVHYYWSRPDHIYNQQLTLNKDKVADWLTEYAKFPSTVSVGNRLVVVPNTCYEQNVINPVPLVQADVRNPTPAWVIWDLAAQPEPIRDPATSALVWEKRFSYWLYLRTPISNDLKKIIDNSTKDANDKSKDSTLPPYQAEEARFAISTSAVTITIPYPKEYMGYLLTKSWLTRNISVCVGTDTTPIFTNKVQSNTTIQQQTLAARGDPNFQFDAMIYLTYNKGTSKWEVKVASSLEA